jgi:hypothetical protein
MFLCPHEVWRGPQCVTLHTWRSARAQGQDDASLFQLPVFDKTFEFYCDVSGISIGGILF